MNAFAEEIREARESVRQIADKFHIVAPMVTMERKLVDKNGKVLDAKERLAKSWTRNGYNLLAYNMIFPSGIFSTTVFGDGYLSVKNVTGSVGSNSTYSYGFNGVSSPPEISIGTGTDAESFDDIALNAEIASGTGAGQMVRGTTSRLSAWYGGVRTMRTTVTKTFTNNSGSSIVVAESGITVGCSPAGSTTGSISPVLMQRDVFTGEEVANGKAYTVTYKFDVVYP